MNQLDPRERLRPRFNYLGPGRTTPQQPQNLMRPSSKGNGMAGCTSCYTPTALASLGGVSLRGTTLGAVDEYQVSPTVATVYGLASLAGGALGAYHGYRRWDSVWGGIGWFFLGSLFPIIAVPVAFAQGFGERR